MAVERPPMGNNPKSVKGLWTIDWRVSQIAFARYAYRENVQTFGATWLIKSEQLFRSRPDASLLTSLMTMSDILWVKFKEGWGDVDEVSTASFMYVPY